MEDQQQLAACPFCGASAYVASETDDDDIRWHYVRCRGCGTRSRGNWHSPGNDCPQFYAEVRDEWNRRASPSSSVLERARADIKKVLSGKSVYTERAIQECAVAFAEQPQLYGAQANELASYVRKLEAAARSALAEIDRALGGGNAE